MKANMTTLEAAAKLEAGLAKLNAKHETNTRELLAKFSPEAVALFNRLQSEKAKAAEGKAS